MDKDDPFASIVQFCDTQRSRLRNATYVLPPPTTSPSADNIPLYGAIPSHLIRNFLCFAPDPPNSNNEHTTRLCVESSEVSPPPPEDFLPPCVESFEDLPVTPPQDFLLESSDVEKLISAVDHHCEGQRIDVQGGTVAGDVACTDSYPCDGLGLWLSELKSMAISQTFSGDVVSFLTKFRASVFFSKDTNLGSLLKLKGKKVSVSVSVSGERSSSRKRKHSDTNVGLGSSKYNTRSKLVDANVVDEVARSEYPSMRKNLGLSSKLKTKNVAGGTPSKKSKESQVGSEGCESRINAEANLSGNKNTEKYEFRGEYWVSRGLFHSKEKNFGSSSKSITKKDFVSVLGEPTLKQPKHSENILVLKPSTSLSGSELVETEVTTVIVLSESEEEEGGGFLKESEVGGSKGDKSDTIANSNVAGNRSTEYLGKSTDVFSSDGISKCPAELCEPVSVTCGAVTKNTATSGGMRSGSSSSNNAFLTMVLDALQIVRDANPGGVSANAVDGMHRCPAKP